MIPTDRARNPRRKAHLDATDLGILVALQTAGRSSAAELARRAGRRETTVRDRMDALAASNIIRSYRADVDLDLVCANTKATVHASIDLRELPRIRAALAALPCVLSADVVSGDRGIMIQVVARSIADLAAVVRRDLAPLGLSAVDVRVTLATMVATRPAVLVDESKEAKPGASVLPVVNPAINA